MVSVGCHWQKMVTKYGDEGEQLLIAFKKKSRNYRSIGSGKIDASTCQTNKQTKMEKAPAVFE